MLETDKFSTHWVAMLATRLSDPALGPAYMQFPGYVELMITRVFGRNLMPTYFKHACQENCL